MQRSHGPGGRAKLRPSFAVGFHAGIAPTPPGGEGAGSADPAGAVMLASRAGLSVCCQGRLAVTNGLLARRCCELFGADRVVKRPARSSSLRTSTRPTGAAG